MFKFSLVVVALLAVSALAIASPIAEPAPQLVGGPGGILLGSKLTEGTGVSAGPAIATPIVEPELPQLGGHRGVICRIIGSPLQIIQLLQLPKLVGDLLKIYFGRLCIAAPENGPPALDGIH